MNDKDVFQNIDGEHHQIAAGDINNITSSEPEFDDGNPYKTSCPQCGRTTGRFSAFCRNCDFEVKEYFDRLEANARKKEIENRRFMLENIGMGILVLGVAIISISIHFKIETMVPFYIGLIFSIIGILFTAANR